jgi:hypothetical protein
VKREIFCIKNNSRGFTPTEERVEKSAISLLPQIILYVSAALVHSQHHESAEFCTTMANVDIFLLGTDLIHEISMIN